MGRPGVGWATSDSVGRPFTRPFPQRWGWAVTARCGSPNRVNVATAPCRPAVRIIVEARGQRKQCQPVSRGAATTGDDATAGGGATAGAAADTATVP